MPRTVNNLYKKREMRPLGSLCAEIYQDNYVLVVGGDAILRSDCCGGNSRDFIDAIVDQYIADEDINVQGDQERKNIITEFLSDYEYDVAEHVNPDLMGVLRSKCFRVVITTAFDGYVEAAMREVWKDELRVVNIYDNSDISSFGKYSEYDLVPPTLIYAMGKADSSIAKFVYTEDDAIDLIATRWIAKQPKTLIDFIRRKKVLAIGCKYDDWEFRFFWYSLRQDLSNLNGDVAISLDANSPSDASLLQYLRRKRVGNKGNSQEFLHSLLQEMTSPNEFVYEKLKSRMAQGGIFISYASEDFHIVCQIYKVLSDNGCKVWFDNAQLLGGDKYDERISAAISQCKVFIMILSRQTMHDLKSQNHRYYMEEWAQAADNTDCLFIPVTLSGFDIRKGRDLLPNILNDKSAINWGLDGPANLIAAVKNKMSQL